MFIEEAKWIEKAIQSLPPLLDNNTVANLGSSTAALRQIIQPQIQDCINNALEKNGLTIKHIDLKEQNGVDIIADITDTRFGKEFANKFGITICTNMLEHVNDILACIKNILAITVIKGYILITVPYKYKLHFDPIDNGFRPKPEEIFNLFPLGSVKIIENKIITIKNICAYKLKKSNFPLWGYRERIKYLFGKRYKVSGVLLQVVSK